MKKLKIGLFILFILIATISAKNTYAATNNDMLISLGTGGYQITVYKTTTIDDIINVSLIGVGLAMGICIIVTSVLKQIDVNNAITMLGIGISCLAIYLLKNNRKQT